MNKIVLNTIGVNTVRLNTVGEWRKSEGGGGGGSISYPGLIAAWSAKGKSNYDEDRAILKDLTGNGHDITLNGFAFSEMSGYGGYLIAINKMWGNNLTYDYKKVYPTYTVFSKTGLFTRFQKGNVLYGKKLRFKVTGIKDNNHWISVNWYHFLTPNLPNKSEKYYGDFEITVPSEEDYNSNADMSPYIAISVSGVDEVCNITIELLPEYPDALVFDGVDDYGSAVDFGGKEIKTVISKYQTLSVSPNRFSLYFKDPLNGNIFQRIRTLKIQSNPSIRAYSDNVTLLDDYCKIDRNTKALTRPFQITGCNGNIEVENIAFYSAYLFDRSLDEQEIKSFIRKYIDPEYLLPSEIPTPDCYYDFSQGSNDDETRDTIKDLSGNGNDAVAHNFAWIGGMSGYGGYPFVWTAFTQEGADLAYDEKNKVTIKNSSIPLSRSCLFKTGFTGTNFKIKVTNKPDDITLQIGSSDAGKQELFNGENTITLTFSNMPIGLFVTPCTDQNIIIEIVPKYPGALVFDGVDDYISLDAFDSGFKTVFMVCKPFVLDKLLYDQRINDVMDFAIYNQTNTIAYGSRNSNQTYINNILNTKIKTNNLINKKHLIGIISNTDKEKVKPILCSNTSKNSGYANIALYKFLGFKEALTEEQINAIIKKYNLLDEVDEIEVS